MDQPQQNSATARPLASRQPNPSEALRRSEEQFRLLVEAVTEYAIFRLDPEGHITSWNAGAERIKGYTEEEILGHHFSTFYPAEDVEAGMPDRVLETACREGQWTGEGWRVRKDGSRFWAHVTVTALRGDAGELRGFAEVTHDMTERKEREEELEQERRRADRRNAFLRLMQTVAATANDADSLEEAMREAMRAVCEHTGWPVGHVYRVDRQDGDISLVPTGIWSLQSEEQFSRFRAVTKATSFAMGEGLPGRAAECGEPVWIRDTTEDPTFVRARVAEDIGVKGAFGVPVRHKGKTVAVLEFFSAKTEEPNEKLIEAMASVGVQLSRVAEREHVEQALQESEAKFRALAEESPVGILLIQEDGRFKYANEALAEMYGYSRDELFDMAYSELVHPGDRQRVRKNIKKRLDGKRKSMQFRFRGRTKGGETIRVDAYGTRVEYQGSPAIIGMDIDVTDRLRLQRELLRVQEEERRRIGQDLHDGVASQLTGISIMMGVLARRLDSDDDLAERVREIRKLVNESCDDVRRLSRGLAPAGLSGKSFIEVLKRLAKTTEGGRFEQDDALPPLEDDAAAHLYWIAQEAVTNARKYAGADRITIRLRNKDGILVLEVEDDGKGFHSEKIEGGLGLRSMHYRADLLSGTLTVDSSPGKGTRICCRLPE